MSIKTPSIASDDDQDAQRLQRMFMAGLSRYEPDPRIALLKKKRDTRARLTTNFSELHQSVGMVG